MEIIISNILRYGVALSFIIVTLGSVLLLLQPGTAVRPAGPPVPHDPAVVIMQVLQFQPKAIIEFGLMILIATPVFRVGVAVIAFLMESDYVYSLVSLFVFLVLTASFFLGHAGGGRIPRSRKRKRTSCVDTKSVFSSQGTVERPF